MVAPSDVQVAFREGAAVLERPDVYTLELTGPDRARFLNGMISAEVGELSPGQGAMAVKVTNRGRVEGVMRVRATETAFELDVLEVAAERVLKSLAGFIIMDDCAIVDITPRREVLAIYGPEARAMLGLPEPLAPHSFVVREGDVMIRDAMLNLEGYELHVPAGRGMALIDHLLSRGAKRASWPDLDVARVEAGAPLDGRDLDDDTLPMEARLDHALNTTKGCYIGQEVIARAINLGGVKHILVGLVLSGDVAPEAGTPLYSGPGGPRTGELTSVVYSSMMGSFIALGYVHKKDETPGTQLIAKAEAEDGKPPVAAEVTALPFKKRS